MVEDEKFPIIHIGIDVRSIPNSMVDILATMTKTSKTKLIPSKE